MRRGGNWRTILIDKQNIQQALTDNSMTPCLSRHSVEFTANVLACLPLFLLTWENQKPLRLDFHPLSECCFCHPPGQRNAGTRTLKPLGPGVITSHHQGGGGGQVWLMPLNLCIFLCGGRYLSLKRESAGLISMTPPSDSAAMLTGKSRLQYHH